MKNKTNKNKKYSRVVFWSLLGILFIATLFRFAFLTSIPDGIHPDAAAYATDAYHAHTNDDRKAFYEANFGREGLFINIASYFFDIFGVSYFVFKSLGAIIGVLSVWGMYFFAKEASQRKLVGLLASFFMAISFWMVLFDRTGFRATISILALTWCSYFFLKALRTNKWQDYVFSGFFVGIGLNSYIAFRVAPVAIFLALLFKLFLEKTALRKRIWTNALKHKGFVLIVITSFIVCLPLFSYFYQHPETFVGRSNEISVFNQPETLKLTTLSTAAALGIYNFFGDPNWRHNFSTEPILNSLEGFLFVFGFILVIKTFFQKTERNNIALKVSYFYIILVFFLMVLPAGLSYSPAGIPHALRSLDTAPTVFILMAIAFVFIFDRTKKSFTENGNQKPFLATIALVISLMTIDAAMKYFVRWGMNDRVNAEFAQDYTNISKYISEKANQGKTVLAISESSEVEFFTFDLPNFKMENNFKIENLNQFSPDLIIFTNYHGDGKDLEMLQGLGWKETERPNLGAGGHNIKIFSQNNF